MNMDDLKKFLDEEFGSNDLNMRRDRPYDGQSHTHDGIRGSTKIHGITFRDMRDCFIRASCLSAGLQSPARYDEALLGENAGLCENDIYALDWNDVDPIAVLQNLVCEVERLMGIFPNVPGLEKE